MAFSKAQTLQFNQVNKTDILKGHTRFTHDSLKYAYNGRSRNSSGTGKRPMLVISASDKSEEGMMLPSGVVDYYELLKVDPLSSMKEIKQAYYSSAKECHPDFTGDEGHDMCVLLNAAYEILSDPIQRSNYDRSLIRARINDQDGYTGVPVSKWGGPSDETRAVFVDECTCIGCKNCVWEAPATFRIEPEHGRSRVFAQWLDSEENIQIAIESCPVDCIHMVTKAQLPVLEHVMQKIERVSVGIMSSGQGAVGDPFAAAATFAKKRAEMEKTQMQANRETAAQREAKRKAAEEIRKRTSGFKKRWPGNSGTIRRDGQEASMPVDRSIVVSGSWSEEADF
mmetsp:Transcript_21804/g.30331  ORF Transcript_21804/g.30331 Transcript_21804/m.30331 type:complete len:339 (-) Transcript_21804:35-1051(-)|eukprot:CAMPEP_0196587126 /NCGR_PEP_ID=MMETSP1081-20130531/56526_1 /TAXON_ID=36882 /ORGANISM="Pyramimonas amylifera, Strain CCMP720" /LENGTH=338 /DNA_ID=CAMNT_0041909225 /DNA_START=57 /DNA_END=1073 /DNA_ORIENTATION=+